MANKIDRTAIAVNNLEESAEFFSELLGIEFDDVGTSKEMGMRVAYSLFGLELIEPTGPDSIIGRFLKNHGEGLWAIVIKVDDLDKAVERFKAKGLRVAGSIGPPLREVAFHPKDAHGVEIVLTEYPERHPASMAGLGLMDKVPVIGKGRGGQK